MATQKQLSIMMAAVMLVMVVVPSHGCATGGVAYEVGVGDPVGWSIPPNPDFYANWSSTHYFKIGDTLVFNFEGGLSNVVQVTKQDYEGCTAYKPIRRFNKGPATFRLQEKGVSYFICTVSNYCSLGQKISIIVNECSCPASSAPSPLPHSVSPPPAAVSPPLSPSSSSSPNVSQPPVDAQAPSRNQYGFPPQVAPPAKSSASPKGMLGVGYGIFLGLLASLICWLI